MVCFTFLRFEESIPFANSLLSNFPPIEFCLKWVILNESKASVICLLSSFLSRNPFSFSVFVVVVCLRKLISDDPIAYQVYYLLKRY